MQASAEMHADGSEKVKDAGAGGAGCPCDFEARTGEHLWVKGVDVGCGARWRRDALTGGRMLLVSHQERRSSSEDHLFPMGPCLSFQKSTVHVLWSLNLDTMVARAFNLRRPDLQRGVQ